MSELLKPGSLVDIPGVKVGHSSDLDNRTGCTVVLLPDGSISGVDVRGGAPGSRETDLLRPMGHVPGANAFVLSGGSAFGLDAAQGVVRFLRDNDIGYQTSDMKIPIVPAAILYDLGIGEPIAPTQADGYEAAKKASSENFAVGSVGAGTGATVAKLLGPQHRLKGGLGTASIRVDSSTGADLFVAALAVTNAMGAIYDFESGETLASPGGSGKDLSDLVEALASDKIPRKESSSDGNTTLVIVGTNAHLDSVAVNRLAMSGSSGMARAIWPVHTRGDGDLVFSFATQEINCEEETKLAIEGLAALITARAITNSIIAAA